MLSRNLLSHYSMKPYRVCPDCQSKYTTDDKTRMRSWVLAIFGLFTIALSTAGFLIGFPWGLAAFVSATGLLIYLGYVLSKTRYVEYRR